MGLQSNLFQGDQALEACLIRDASHVTPGAVGDHVCKIQTALSTLDGSSIDAGELAAKRYGPSTAAAVLAFKKKRNIINRSYQTQADNIVGKMTIAALDKEMLAKEGERKPTCQLYQACPSEVVFRNARLVQVNFAIGAPAGFTGAGAAPAPLTDAQVMQIALQDSRRTLRQAIGTLTVLQGKLTMGNEIMSDEERRALVAVVSWLKIDPPLVSPEGKRKIAGHIGTAITLMTKNLAVKTRSGASPTMRRFTSTVHAQVYDNPDQGIDCGNPFFTVDGPNCRRDVITHEFFHFVGVHHGGGALNGPTIRMNIRTTAQAFDSADNLAQLVAEITTPGGKTDACARANE